MTLSENGSGLTVADMTTNKYLVEKKLLDEKDLTKRDYIIMAKNSLTSPILTNKGLQKIQTLRDKQEEMDDAKSLFSRENIIECAEMTSEAVQSVTEKDSSINRKRLTPEEVRKYMLSVNQNYIRNMQIIWGFLQSVESLELGDISYENLVSNSSLLRSRAEDRPLVELIVEIDEAFNEIIEKWRNDKDSIPSEGWDKFNRAVRKFADKAEKIILKEDNKNFDLERD